jgi:transaldolase/transaldolase/glucose-6-phosphate isomerase
MKSLLLSRQNNYIMNSLLARIAVLGQSIWLDYGRRGLIESGLLQEMIEQDDLRGITSNPAMFEEAISRSKDYEEAIFRLALASCCAEEIYQTIAIEDVQRAADIFFPTYEKTKGMDGYVSLEVSPNLAYDTEGTILEARKLWKRLNRPNVMVKIPGTQPALPAIQQLISEGININVTLLFSLERYRSVVDAYFIGLEHRMRKGEPIDKVVSVASFFLSCIDTLVDALLEKKKREDFSKAKQINELRGQVAIASAKVAYQCYKKEFSSLRYKLLHDKGAHKQRLLWASTSTQNPYYCKVKYVDALIGTHTINTMPLETLGAYKSLGDPARRLTEGVTEARKALGLLQEVGIDLTFLTRKLEQEGIQKFIKPYNNLLQLIEEKRKEALSIA